MEYILFAFLALIASCGNTIFNRLGANHASALTNATVKSFFIVIACFFISLVLGHVPSLYTLHSTDWIWIGVVGVLTAIDWFFYFLAIKRTHLEVFSPFCTGSMLFTSNLLFMIFMFLSVTNGGKAFNIVLYVVGLICLLIAIIFVVLNKEMNPSHKRMWVIFEIVSSVSYAFLLLIVKLKLSHLPSDVISFHQMLITFTIMAVASICTKSIFELKKIRFVDHLYIFVGAVFNGLMTICQYTALSYENSVPAIVNVIVGINFIIVSVITVIFFKAKNKIPLTITLVLVFSGMVLNLLAGLL